MGRIAAVVGATGLVGGHLVELLGESYAYERVIVLARRPIPGVGDRIEVRTVDFDALAVTAGDLAVDDAFCALGTTRKKAGSDEAFVKVDLAYVRAFAELVRPKAKRFVLVSALGADPGSRVLYNRTKGEAERAVSQLGFEKVDILRPSFLDGDRDESRPGERIGAALARAAAVLPFALTRRMRPIDARAVAAAMVCLALAPGEGVVVHESDAIARLAAP